MRLALFIALTHLRVRVRQSLVAALSVGLGAMILVVTLAMMQGLLEEFRNKLLEASPPVTVEPRPAAGAKKLLDAPGVVGLARGGAPRDRDYISNFPELAARIAQVDGAAAAAPRACAPVVAYHGTRSQKAIVCGIDVRAEKQVTNLWRWMVEGRMDDLDASADAVILGRILAKRLSAKAGSRVRLVTPGGVTADFRVAGVFASGITKIDESQSFVRLPQGRRLAGLGGGAVTAVSVGVTDIGRVTEVAREIERRTGFTALTWEEANQSGIAAFRMQGMITYFLVIFTAVVGGFGILSIMVTIVMEKARDIAILRSMGFTAGQVLRIFLLESLALGAAGGALGCATGGLLAVLISRIPFRSGDSSSLQLTHFTMLIDPWFFVIAFVISLTIAVAAGVGPARRAARLDPVAALRGER